jgi:hypothetical protein
LYLNINSNIKVDLPDNYNLEERKILCEQIIEEYKEYFTYTLPGTKNDRSGEKVQRRLSVMATYIYNSGKDIKTDNIMTEYREKRNREREIKFSTVDFLEI